MRFILTEKFTQDPLEEYFSKHRGFCGRNDNPSVQQFRENALKMQVCSSSTVRASVYANCTARLNNDGQIPDTPLEKRRRISDRQ